MKIISNKLYSKLPIELQKITEPFEGREKDIVLISSLCVLSNCFPNIYGYYDGHKIYPNLYGLIIAPPASGKGVMIFSRILIEKIHYKLHNESKIEVMDYMNNKKKTNDKSNHNYPKLKVKILPANISNAEMYSFFGANNDGLLILETEAETISNMFKQDWSNYSDVLRKAFHHENISISRKIEKIFEDIKEPKLSLIIGGTLDQLIPLVKSTNNGLYSRFIVYFFNESSTFKNVFDKKKTNINEIFQKFGDDIYIVYNKLLKSKVPFVFKLKKEHENMFVNKFNDDTEHIKDTFYSDFLPNLFRHALMSFKIAMIFTILRNMSDIENKKELVCSDNDFHLSYDLIKTLLIHCSVVFDDLQYNTLPQLDINILKSLKKDFKTKDAYDIGIKFNISKRVMIDKLNQWIKKKFIIRISKGNYQKT